MRQQCLANEMEKASELGADIISLLYISPWANKDFQKVTSPQLKSIGSSVTEIWKSLVVSPNRFLSVNIEDMFWDFPVQSFPEMSDWMSYIKSRYEWI